MPRSGVNRGEHVSTVPRLMTEKHRQPGPNTGLTPDRPNFSPGGPGGPGQSGTVRDVGVTDVLLAILFVNMFLLRDNEAESFENACRFPVYMYMYCQHIILLESCCMDIIDQFNG